MHKQWVRINRVNPKAVQRNVDTAFSGMENEVSWFYLTSSIEKCWLNCSVGSYHVTYWDWRFFHCCKRKCRGLQWTKAFFFQIRPWFVKDILEIEPQQLALKFKAWCVSGLGEKKVIIGTRMKLNLLRCLDKVKQSTRAPTWSKIISQCWTMIQESLGTYSFSQNRKVEKLTVWW